MESDLRRKVVRELRPLDAMAVENTVYRGTPDVECTLAWFELKWLEQWPLMLSSKLRVWHFTTQQRAWLRRRWKANRGAYMLLQVGTTYLIFDGETAAKIVSRVSCEELLKHALVVWNDWEPGRLLQWLQSRSSSATSSASTLPPDDRASVRPARVKYHKPRRRSRQGSAAFCTVSEAVTGWVPSAIS
jgi:hypothetical protein